MGELSRVSDVRQGCGCAIATAASLSTSGQRVELQDANVEVRRWPTPRKRATRETIATLIGHGGSARLDLLPVHTGRPMTTKTKAELIEASEHVHHEFSIAVALSRHLARAAPLNHAANNQHVTAISNALVGSTAMAVRSLLGFAYGMGA